MCLTPVAMSKVVDEEKVAHPPFLLASIALRTASLRLFVMYTCVYACVCARVSRFI